MCETISYQLYNISSLFQETWTTCILMLEFRYKVQFSYLPHVFSPFHTRDVIIPMHHKIQHVTITIATTGLISAVIVDA